MGHPRYLADDGDILCAVHLEAVELFVASQALERIASAV
jgi:hypothetical protein